MTIRRQRIARRMTWLGILSGTVLGVIMAAALLMIANMVGS